MMQAEAIRLFAGWVHATAIASRTPLGAATLWPGPRINPHEQA